MPAVMDDTGQKRTKFWALGEKEKNSQNRDNGSGDIVLLSKKNIKNLRLIITIIITNFKKNWVSA